jgi:thiol-disulfide isomerase/thioredoxin
VWPPSRSRTDSTGRRSRRLWTRSATTPSCRAKTGRNSRRCFDGSKKVDLKTIPVPGKITVVDYWAEWCSPCHFLEKRLQHLLNENPNMALRRVNVGKWDNAAAKQATAEFRLEALPYVRVYDSRGKFVDEVTGGSWDQFLKVLDKARARG